MSTQKNKKPTYTLPVAICAGLLFVGSILLAVLMATREMAPPRKYEVDMSGTIIGIDTTSKIPVLTKEEAKEVEKKENKKVEYVETPEEKEKDNLPPPEPIIVPSTPPTVAPEDKPNNAQEQLVPKPSKPDIKISDPKIEPIN